MPKYEVTIPDLGKFEVNSPKDLTEDEAYRIAVAEATKQTGGDGELSRQLGLTARAGITGVAGLPLLAGDALNNLYNMISQGVKQGTGVNIGQLPMASQSAQQLMTEAGLPEPRGKQERVVQDIASSHIMLLETFPRRSREAYDSRKRGVY
jgi:predicted amino acid racemase